MVFFSLVVLGMDGWMDWHQFQFWYESKSSFEDRTEQDRTGRDDLYSFIELWLLENEEAQCNGRRKGFF